jgi:RNase adapter protein RapZ
MSTELLIVSGYSGGGKSLVLNFVEDLGYYCVDNLPIRLIEPFLNIYEKDLTVKRSSRIAICVDIRSSLNFGDCKNIIDSLKNKKGYRVTLLFITSDKNVLIHRFQESRRIHPLTSAKGSTINEAIDTELALMEPLRRISDIVIDTTLSNVHELKQEIFALFSTKSGKNTLKTRVVSFGFSMGIPSDLDMIFDVRFLPNPHFEKDLRPLTGKDKPVIQFMEKQNAMGKFWKHLTSLMDFLTPLFIKEGKTYLSIGIGCTGGKHRSVMIAEKLNKYFGEKGLPSVVEHRDIYRMRNT